MMDSINGREIWLFLKKWFFKITQPSPSFTKAHMIRRARVLSILSLLFAMLFLIGGGISIDDSWLYFPAAFLLFLGFILTKTRYHRISPFLFICTILAFNITITTISSVRRESAQGQSGNDFIVGVFETPWNVSILLASILFFREPKITFPLLICELVIIIVHQALLVVFFNNQQVSSALRASIIGFVLCMSMASLSYYDLSDLIQKEKRIKNMFSMSREGLCVYRDGSLIDVNPAFNRLFQVKKSQAVRQPLSSFLPQLEYINVGDAEVETIAIDSVGREFYVEVKSIGGGGGGDIIAPTPNANILSILDITSRHQLMEADLAARRANAASEAKSLFLANMTHELRTPINGVLSSIDVLENTELLPVQKEFLGYMRLSANTLLDLVTDILDFSKIEAGRLELEQAPFNILTAVEESMTIVSRSAFEKGLDLQLLIESDVPIMLVGDKKRVKQIFLNLLSNAIKFTSSGQITVRLRVDQPLVTSSSSPDFPHHQHNNSTTTASATATPPTTTTSHFTTALDEEEDFSSRYNTNNTYTNNNNNNNNNGNNNSNNVMGGSPRSSRSVSVSGGSVSSVVGNFVNVSVSVEDTGIGIKQESIGRLFNVFTQVDPSSTKNYAGTGLGLSIVKRLCRLMGGDISCVSNYGKGSTFSFHIRALISDQSPTLHTIADVASGDMKKELLRGSVGDDASIKKINIMAVVATSNVLLRQSITQYLKMLKMEYLEMTSEAELMTFLKELKKKDDTFAILFTTYDLLALTPRTLPRISSLSASTSLPPPQLPTLPRISSLSNSTTIPPPQLPTLPPTNTLHVAKLSKGTQSSNTTYFDTFVWLPVHFSSIVRCIFSYLNYPIPPYITSVFGDLVITPTAKQKNIAISTSSLPRSSSLPHSSSSSSSLSPIASSTIALSPAPSEANLLKSSSFLSRPNGYAEIRNDDVANNNSDVVDLTKSTGSSDGVVVVTPEGKRILVVEDNVVNYKVLTKWLSDAGYTSYDVAYNGQQAVDMFSQPTTCFDLILMDISMPVMDGYTAAAKIRAREKELVARDPTYKRVPIIALTANASERDKNKCLDSGMDDYITKPIKSRDVILDMIAKHLH